jgi:ABC-type multidrug transport system fused ATPase/permease subunit
MAKALIALTSKYQTIRYDDGLKYGIIFLILSLIQGISNFLMIWMFSRIGVSLARIYRKKVLRKYLELHMSFYDINQKFTRLSLY